MIGDGDSPESGSISLVYESRKFLKLVKFRAHADTIWRARASIVRKAISSNMAVIVRRSSVDKLTMWIELCFGAVRAQRDQSRGYQLIFAMKK